MRDVAMLAPGGARERARAGAQAGARHGCTGRCTGRCTGTTRFVRRRPRNDVRHAKRYNPEVPDIDRRSPKNRPGPRTPREGYRP